MVYCCLFQEDDLMEITSKNFGMLETEEIKALKMFIPLFFIIYIFYDFAYYYLLPFIGGERNTLWNGISEGVTLYIYILAYLPVVILLVKKGRAHYGKYLLFAAYTSAEIFNNFLFHIGSALELRNGNIAEIFFILFAPIFINKKYFYIVFGITTFKYVFLYIWVYNNVQVILGYLLVFIFALLAFLLLRRFSSYVGATIEISNELRHTEKLAAVGKFATSISHEVRNPLASLRGFTQLQHEKHPDDSVYYNIMTKEIDRITSLLDDLLVIGKPKGMNFEYHDFKRIVEYTLTIMENDANNQDISFTRVLESSLPEIECDNKHIKQVLINLLKNGIEAMPSGGDIIVKAECFEANKIKLTIKDSGEGISKENLNKLGTPFHTTKSDGTGLGLMVSFKIIEEHHGTIHYESREGEGTAVSVVLPVTQPFS
jgi:signal transduction histidine kinase